LCLSPAAIEHIAMRKKPPVFSIALLSAGALAFEILLMRLLSIVQWHHFAYMIIGLALLGYGVSGIFVTIARRWLAARYAHAYLACLLLFSISSPLSYLIAQAVPFNSQEILWHPHQAVYLFLLFFFLAVPFFFAACAICITLAGHSSQAGPIYGFDLLGAGLGALAMVTLLWVVFPQTALVLVSIGGLISAAIAAWELRLPQRKPVTVAVICLSAVAALSAPFLQLKMSPYKSLQQHLRIMGARMISQHSSPLGLISVMENTTIPLRHAPGLSLNNIQEPLPQLGVFTDGDNMTVITKRAERPGQLAYLDQISSAAPYHLTTIEKVLILGAGGGADILQARYHGASIVEAVEMNPQIVGLMRKQYRDFAGKIFNGDTSRMHMGEIRGFIKQSKQHYDLIQLTMIDGFNASIAGLYALNESYLYTVEAMADYLARLSPEGYLCVSRWIKIPPRDTLKLLATAVDALEGMGVEKTKTRLVLIRSWQTSTLIIKNGDFTQRELDAVQTFCRERAFDIAFGPNISRDQVNRYNVLKQPFFYQAAQALTGGQTKPFMQRYKFNITPATDNRPYFHHFFKWSSFWEIWRLRKQGGAPLLESGYLVLVATAAVAVFLSGILILFPLWFFRRNALTRSYEVKKTHTILYFFTIGIAFIFIEMAFIQRFVQFLNHPILAISTSLTAFLMFAGIGSFWSRRMVETLGSRKTLRRAVAGIALISIVYIIALHDLFALFLDQPTILKIMVSIVLIAPLAILMGMPFPLALSGLAGNAEPFIPWAWGINGCASVISASVATLIAIQFGFTVVIGLAVVLYLVAWRLSSGILVLGPSFKQNVT
jgi:hypothetical protein